jgi:hypothetical protein
MYAMQLPITPRTLRGQFVFRNVLGVGVSSWRLWRANFGYSGPFVRMSVVNSDDITRAGRLKDANRLWHSFCNRNIHKQAVDESLG